MAFRTHLYTATALITGICVGLSLRSVFSYLKSSRRLQFIKPQDDNTETFQSDDQDSLSIKETDPPKLSTGIESCIGNTPLIKIKSLSDATGCEILAKVEVSSYPRESYMERTSRFDETLVHERSRW